MLPVAVLACSALVVAACGADDDPASSGGDAPDLILVAGGGDDPSGTTADTVQLHGAASDLEVRDGTSYLLVNTGTSNQLVTVDPDGALTVTDFGADSDLRYLAVGADGTVYVAGPTGIHELAGDTLEPVVGLDAAAGGVVSPDTSEIIGLAVDGDGRVVWPAAFLGQGPDEGSEPVMTHVYRLEDDEPVLVAGADSADVEGDELAALGASPPADATALDFPLDGYGAGGAFAAGDDGALYLGGPASVLRIGGDGSVEAILSDGDRAFPDEPFADAGDAQGFGGSWVGSGIAVAGETVAVVDRFPGLEDEQVSVDAFGWGGDLGDAQELADRIVRGLDTGEEAGDDDSTTYGQAAVLVHDGQAATAMAHVQNVALDGDRLYVVGATGESGTDSDLLIVSAPVPDDWR